MDKRKEITLGRIKEIVGLEWQLGLKFPQSYRQFLLERGSAVIDGYQIFGLPEEKEKSPPKGFFIFLDRNFLAV